MASAAATNATTEVLNGIAKLANRTGRVYSFEAVRAKLLYAKHTLSATHSFRSYLTCPTQRNMGVRKAEIARLIEQYELVSAELERLRREAEG